MDGKQLMEQGIMFVSEGREEWLGRVREYADKVLLAYRPAITSDDLQEVFDLPGDAHRNLWGAVFHDKRFKCVGFTQSRRPEAHARTIRMWSRA